MRASTALIGQDKIVDERTCFRNETKPYGSKCGRNINVGSLPGTIKLQGIDKVDNLPLWGLINRVCYTKLVQRLP